MKTLKEFFNTVYSIDDLKNDINIATKEKEEKNKEILEFIPYLQIDNYIELIEYISKEIAFKTFKLGFSLGTKLTAEAFVSNEDNTN